MATIIESPMDTTIDFFLVNQNKNSEAIYTAYLQLLETIDPLLRPMSRKYINEHETKSDKLIPLAASISVQFLPNLLESTINKSFIRPG